MDSVFEDKAIADLLAQVAHQPAYIQERVKTWIDRHFKLAFIEIPVNQEWLATDHASVHEDCDYQARRKLGHWIGESIKIDKEEKPSSMNAYGPRRLCYQVVVFQGRGAQP